MITLTAKNPQAAKNVVRFDHTSGEYASVKLNETMIDHLDIESTCLHKESAEAKAQIDRSGGHYRNGEGGISVLQYVVQITMSADAQLLTYKTCRDFRTR